MRLYWKKHKLLSRLSPFAGVGAAMLLLSACAASRKQEGGSPAAVRREMRSLLRTKVEAAGVGLPDPRSKGSRARRLSAKRSALENGVLELTAAILSLETESGALLRERSAEDPHFTERVRRLARRAAVSRVDWTSDDGCILHLELPRKLVEKKLKVMLR